MQYHRWDNCPNVWRPFIISPKMVKAEKFPIKAVHKREITWMNVQLKQLIQKSNKLCMDLRTNHKEWLETNRKITRLKEESNRATWHRQLHRNSKSKDAKQSWSTVRSLSGKESCITGKSPLNKGSVRQPQLSFKSM